MKQSALIPMLLYIAFFLTSCGGGSNEKTTVTDSTSIDTTAKTNVEVVKSTIVTSPQNLMIATHKVANFSKWMASYEGHDSMRLVNGIHSYVIGRGLQDSNMVLVAVKIDDTAKAKAFAKDPGLKKAMKEGGVIGAPTISFITATWQDTAKIDSKLRSQSMFTVKDWDVWVKAFKEGEQERIANGIIDRVVSHDFDDDKKVSLVVALTDTAKAFAYFKSDELKNRRIAGGVIGEPQRFLFQIVRRY